MTELITVTERDAVRVVTLNRPDDLNVVNLALHRELLDVWRRVDRDPGARAVVLTGAGRAFSAGGDFTFMKQQQQSLALRYRVGGEAAAILHEMLRFRLPVVAAVNGPAVGLGASLVLSSDLVVMSQKSFLCDPHVSVGLTAGDGGALLWPYMMSLLRAKEHIFLGDRIPADRALELGIANRVTDPDDLMDTALDLARRLADQPARALQTTKRAFAHHVAAVATSIIDYGLAAEAVEQGAPEHEAKIRAAVGPEVWDAIDASGPAEPDGSFAG